MTKHWGFRIMEKGGRTRNFRRVFEEFFTENSKALSPKEAREFLLKRARETLSSSMEKIRKVMKESEKSCIDFSDSFPTELEFVELPEGCFYMGSPEDDDMANQDEQPAHLVQLSEFRMSSTPVTNAVYGRLMELRDLPKPEFWNDNSYSRPGQVVVGVSWYDAIQFCNALSEEKGLSPCYQIDKENKVTWIPDVDGYRLPTEAEWEYACRAGTKTRWWFGDDEDKLSEYASECAWCGELDPNDELNHVASKPPNPWGLYDMHGNVQEWCWDEHDSYHGLKAFEPIVNPLGRTEIGAWDKNRITLSSSSLVPLRGGFWSFNNVRHSRSASRETSFSTTKRNFIGFRCVRGPILGKAIP